MNKDKRMALNNILFQIGEIRHDVTSILFQEQSCLDNMPDNLEGTERYEKFESSVENLEDAIESLKDAVKFIEEAMN